MTITLDASEAALAALDAIGVHYTVDDPVRALADERERGQKFRAGSLKHAAHLERMKRLEEECSSQSGTTGHGSCVHRTTPSISTIQRRHSDFVSIPSGSMKSHSSPPISDLQETAVRALIVLQGCKRPAAEKAVLRASGDDAQSLALNAQKLLEI